MKKDIELISYDLTAKTAVVRMGAQERTLPITNIGYLWNEARTAQTDVLDSITITGFAVKYRTGSKIWKTSITYWFKSQRFAQPHPVLSHSLRFSSARLVGFYDEASESDQSKHNAQR